MNTLTFVGQDRKAGWILFVDGRKTKLNIPATTNMMGLYLNANRKKAGYFINEKNTVWWKVQDVN